MSSLMYTLRDILKRRQDTRRHTGNDLRTSQEKTRVRVARSLVLVASQLIWQLTKTKCEEKTIRDIHIKALRNQQQGRAGTAVYGFSKGLESEPFCCGCV